MVEFYVRLFECVGDGLVKSEGGAVVEDLWNLFSPRAVRVCCSHRACWMAMGPAWTVVRSSGTRRCRRCRAAERMYRHDPLVMLHALLGDYAGAGR